MLCRVPWTQHWVVSSGITSSFNLRWKLTRKNPGNLLKQDAGLVYLCVILIIPMSTFQLLRGPPHLQNNSNLAAQTKPFLQMRSWIWVMTHSGTPGEILMTLNRNKNKEIGDVQAPQNPPTWVQFYSREEAGKQKPWLSWWTTVCWTFKESSTEFLLGSKSADDRNWTEAAVYSYKLTNQNRAERWWACRYRANRINIEHR